MVARPSTFSLADLKALPSHTHITHIACEEGWSYIAEWTGVPLSRILEITGAHPNARYIIYASHQRDWQTSIDMADALHPQTLVAYNFNGAPLPIGHGGPLRLRVSRQLGYKNVKFLNHITVTDSLPDPKEGFSFAPFPRKYSWYAGI
jgi:DMSO/TMAO reductase YedYZ molybdopterin-dependent catalytic subunit